MFRDFKETKMKLMQVMICIIMLMLLISNANNKENMVLAANEESVINDQIVPLGWFCEDTKTYYLDSEGNKVTGFQLIDNKFYLFLDDGIMYKGWITLEQRTFYFDNNGIMQTGECLIDGILYQFMKTGDFLTGWYEIDGKKFYRNQYGYNQSGFIKEQGNLYYVDEIEGLKIGDFDVDGQTYSANDEGKIRTGNYSLNGKVLHYSAQGTFLYGWKIEEGNFKYINQTGVMLLGHQTIDGKEYYFDQNGNLLTNTVIGMYQADENGVLKRLPVSVDTLDAALDEILLKTGKDITSISNYVKGLLRYKYMDKMSSREEMAVYAINNKRVSCYYYEALCGLLLERAGYEVITVQGVGFVYAEHYWSLVKTTRNGVIGWYHVDSLKGMNIKTDAEMVAKGFKWTHSNYPATP